MKKGIQMKKCLSIWLAVVLIGLMEAISCGGGGGSPSSVVKSFYTAVNAGDFDRAEECLTPGQSMKGFNLCQFEGKIGKIKILDELIGEEGGIEVAQVTIDVTLTPAGQSHPFANLEGGTKIFLLEKHKAGWKIVTYY
jgi:hypothetical protein